MATQDEKLRAVARLGLEHRKASQFQKQRSAEADRAQAALDANHPRNVETRDSADPDVAFGDAAQPQSAEELAAFNALEPAEPAAPQAFRRDGRDFYTNADGQLVSVDAGFDTSSAYPDWAPASAERVAARDEEKLQARRGGLGDRLGAFATAGAGSLAEAYAGVENAGRNLGSTWPHHETDRRPEDVAPVAYTDEALEQRQANPKSALVGGLAADVATGLLIPGEGLASSVTRAGVSGLVSAGTDATLTGEPYSVAKAGLYGVQAGLLDGVTRYAWGEAMRGLGKKASAVDNAVAEAQRAAAADAVREVDPVRRAAELRKNAPHLYQEAQTTLDEALEMIDSHVQKAPERMFSPGVLRRTVSDNAVAQTAEVAELGRRLSHAAEVTGQIRAQQASQVLLDAVEAGESGPGLFAAMRQARTTLRDVAEGEASTLLGKAPHSPLIEEASNALDTSLGSEATWGRAAKNQTQFSEALPPHTPPIDVSDVRAREVLDQRLAQARSVAQATGNKPLLSWIRKAEQAIVDADQVTGARLMGPDLPTVQAPTLAQKIVKKTASRAMSSMVGKLAGGIGGGMVGGVPGALGGTILGDILGDLAGPHIERAAERLAGIGRRHGGKIAAAGLVGAGALAAGDEDHDTAAAGLGLLAVPLMLGAGGKKLGLLEAMRKLEPELAKARTPGRDWLDWGTKEKVLTEVFGDAEHPAAKLADSSLERLQNAGVPLSASEKEIEQALTEHTGGAIKDYVQRARKAFSVEQGVATKAARKVGSPEATAARELLGNVGKGLDSPYTGEWKQTDWRGNSIATYSRDGDTVAEVLKRRLADKAPLTFTEIGDDVAPHVEGEHHSWKRSYDASHPNDPAPTMTSGAPKYETTPEYEAWAQRVDAFHQETRQLQHADLAPLRKRIDAAVEALGPDAPQVAKVAAEDAVIRGTVRDALGMKAPKVRELPTNVNATSRYRKNKKGFDAWAKAALDDDKRQALRSWQSRWYRMINADARGTLDETTKFYKEETWFSPEEIERQLEKTPQIASNLIEAMNTAIDAGHTVPGIVTRGISMPAEEVERLVNAKTVTSQGFMSTSIHSTTPEGFATRRAAEYKEVPVMLTVEQKTGVPIGQGEGEITLRPGTKFSVEWVQPANETDGVVTAYLKEIEPSKLTAKDVLQGIAGKIPTEAKVAAGLLAVDAATSDDGSPGEMSAAGVGALALLFGGAKRMRGLQSRVAVLGREIGPMAQYIDDIVAQNEKTIGQVARWGETAERRPFTDAVEKLTEHIEGVALNAQKDPASGFGEALRGAYQTHYFPIGKLGDYVKAAVEHKLAAAAGETVAEASHAAPRVKQFLTERSEGKLGELLELGRPHSVSKLEQEAFHSLDKLDDQLGVSRGPDGLDWNEKDKAARAVGVAEGRFFEEFGNDIRAALNAGGKFPGDLSNGAPASVYTLIEEFEKMAAGAVVDEFTPPKVTETMRAHFRDAARYLIAQDVGARVRPSTYERAASLPALGLRVRAGFKEFLEEDGVEDQIRSYLSRDTQQKGRMDSVTKSHEEILADRDKGVERWKHKIYTRLTDRVSSLPEPLARHVIDDVFESVRKGRPLSGAVDDVITVLDTGAEWSPLERHQHAEASKAFDKWAETASERYGFDIQNTINAYAGDFDYKNINAYARGQMGDAELIKKALVEIEAGPTPSPKTVEALQHMAESTGDAELGEKLAHAIKTDDPEAWALDVADHLLSGPLKGTRPGVQQNPGVTQKAVQLQHALDLAVSDGYVAPGVTYRGALFNDADLARLQQAAETGGSVEAHAFMSTTARPDYASGFISHKKQLAMSPDLHQVVFEVVQKTGVPINEGEAEVLLRAGTRFKIEAMTPEQVLGKHDMSIQTRHQVKYRLVETDHAPKMPDALDARSQLPWVAGGVLAIGAGAAMESDANAAEPDVIPTEEADPEEQMQLDATKQKLDYLHSQAKTTVETTARALVIPSAQKNRTVTLRPGVTMSAGVSGFLGQQSTLRAAFDDKRATLQKLQRDPMALVDEMADGLAEVAHASPELHRQIVAQTYKVVAFLQTKLPGTIGASLLRPDGTPPSDTALRQFALYYSAATNPRTVHVDLANNRARKEQVDTLKELWPESYQDLKLAVLGQLSDGTTRPTLAQRSRLDLLFDFGDALDKALSPRLVKARTAYLAEVDKGAQSNAAPDRRTQPSITGASPLAGLSRGSAAA